MNNNNDIMDLLNLISLIVGVLNLEENLTQGDKQDLLDTFNKKANSLLSEIHSHLQEQDKKIDYLIQQQEKIIKLLKEN